MFYRVNSLSLYLTHDGLDDSNDCIIQYNHFYSLVEKLYPKKTSMQKIYLTLQMMRICKNEKLMNLYLEGYKKEEVKRKRGNKNFFKKLKSFFKLSK